MEWKILSMYLLLLSVFLIQQVSSQELSCKGRCFESFARGRECDCDSDCKKYGKCCPDYENFCGKVTDNKKERTPKKKPTPEPPVVDEAGSGLDNGDIKLTPTPDIPTTQHNKVTTSPKITTGKPINPKPSLPPNSDISKETPSTPNKEATVETKEAFLTNKETSSGTKEKTSTKETRNAEKTPPKDFVPTSKAPVKSTPEAETTTKSPAPTTTKEPTPTTLKKPVPTTPKKPAPTTKGPTPTTPKEPAPTTKEPTPTTPKKPAPTTPKEPAPTTKEPAPTAPKEPTPTPKEPEPTTPKESEPTTPKKPAPITPKEPAPTTTKEPAPTAPKEPTPTPKEPEPTTPKEPAPTTPKKPALTTPKEPAPTAPKEPVPTAPKEPAPTAPKEPTPKVPKKPAPASLETPAPTISEASTTTTTMGPPTTPKNPAESIPEFPAEPTPKALENSPKEPVVPITKAPEVTKAEMTTTAKDKTIGKDIHMTIPEITTAVPKITTQETATPREETTESKTSTTTQVTSITSSKSTPKATTRAPKVMTTTKKTTTTEETVNKPEETTAVPKDTATNPEVSTSKPQKPTKAPKRPTSTKKPKIPKVRKPKTTATPPKMTTSTMPKLHPTSSAEAMLQTTASPSQRLNSEKVEVNPNKDADIAGEKPHMIPRPPVLTPVFIPGTDILMRGSNQDITINPMLSDETNLCNGKPVDGLTTLRNGTLVAFRGHYFWMLSPFNPPPPPRKITEVWGIPSPIDTVFTRCNCEGKTFFFKDSQYWRFTNGVKDPGYPKQIVKGFGGLNGKIVAALSVAKYKNRPESVYFFKRGGSIQQYIYKQEPIKKCPGRRPAINYSVYRETTQVRRRRFEHAIGPSQTHTIRIHYSPIRVSHQDKGFLHNEVKMSLQWRGFPSVVTSAIALPNIRKPDGYDYYAFSRNQYYNIDEPRRTARLITTRSGRSLSNVWYNCP
ncbi:proteoglycan 4 isoform X9 [Leptonychotes weddellii]|uniref:Proteoglycan 4 isoform X9 n=1 Tax=Leptonychotes weddellii TaxID=9713 RepID=A0A7F8QJE8_LEPWE|nr:proteoglycan 4 isoform X9 [Leptonychotes weddellii]